MSINNSINRTLLTSALQLPNWRSALGKMKVGTRNARLLCIGDSTTLGAYSNASGSGDWSALSYPTQLAGLMNSSGVTASADTFLGFSVSGGPFDSRVSVGSGWSRDSAVSVGGNTERATSTTGNLAFTPTHPVDTFIVWYLKFSGGGTFSANVDGGTNTNTSTNAASAIGSVTVTAASVGLHTCNLNWVSGGGVNIIGWDAYNSTVKCVDILQAGWSAAKVADWAATGGYAPGSNIATFTPDLTLIDLTINDAAASTTVSTYSTNLQSIITAAKTSGDVVLVTGNPTQVSSTVALATQQLYQNVNYQLAVANSCPLVDVFGRWISFEYTNPFGLYMTGSNPANLHPQGSGYADITQAIFNMIGNV